MIMRTIMTIFVPKMSLFVLNSILFARKPSLYRITATPSRTKVKEMHCSTHGNIRKRTKNTRKEFMFGTLMMFGFAQFCTGNINKNQKNNSTITRFSFLRFVVHNIVNGIIVFLIDIVFVFVFVFGIALPVIAPQLPNILVDTVMQLLIAALLLKQIQIIRGLYR